MKAITYILSMFAFTFVLALGYVFIFRIIGEFL